MNRKARNQIRAVFGSALLAAAVLLLNTSVGPAEDHADARFRGTGKADPIRIENVRRVEGPAVGQTSVTFDLAWDHSWELGAEQTGGKGPLKLESWDAAWVFVKFRKPGADSYSHAMLSISAADYRVPAGAALEVGLTDDRRRGVGVFVERKTAGHGPNDFKGVTLRWLHGADAPGAVDLKVFALEMVYVPSCAFWAGDGATDHVTGQFSAGVSVHPFRVESERALTLGGETAEALTNRDAAGMDPSLTDDFNIDLIRSLAAEFPKGYQAFYCMKFPHITRVQYAGFLNTLTESEAKGRYYPGYHAEAIQRSGGSPKYVYTPSLPDGHCRWLSWADGAAYAAWAGLRPMTEWEYEKAIRGPQEPDPRYDATPSYWGVSNVNQGEIERPISPGSAAGRKFAGTHGRGTAALPADWPTDLFGSAVFRGKAPPRPYYPRDHLLTSGRIKAITVKLVRGPNIGWRAARTAPAGDTAMTPAHGRLDRAAAQTVSRLAGPVRAAGLLDQRGKPALVLSGPVDLFPVYCRFVPFDYYGRALTPWRGPEDLDAEVYLAWDGDALCVAAEVTDDRHFNTKSGKDLCSGDALQIGLATPSGVTWNVGLGLTKDGVGFHQWKGTGDTLLRTVGCAVVRDEKTKVTRYGLRLPLTALGLERGAEFGFNLVFYDDDGSGIRHWLQLAPGMAPGLPRDGEPVSLLTIGGNTTLFQRLVLEK